MDVEKAPERPGFTYQLKKFVKRVLAEVGYELRRHPPIPQAYDDAVTAAYYGIRGERVAVNAHLDECIVPFGFSFGASGWHPYVLMLEEYQRGDADSYESSFLKRFSDGFEPANAAELLTGDPESPGGLREWPPHAFTMPWDSDTVGVRERKMVRAMLYENSSAGHPDEGIEGGVGAIGPLSETKGKLEYGRLTSLLESVQKKGYLRGKDADGDAKGIALKRDNETRVVLLSGHHRAAVCTALGFDRMPVRLSSPVIVRVGDAPSWPRVVDGTWSEEEARAYFHQLFDGAGIQRARLFGVGR